MPLYDYACQECGRQSELLVSGGREPECPDCGSSRLTRQLPIVASPNRGPNAGDAAPRPGGSCGTGCGCHPH
jgi:putative FmdB family regulatory protein